MTYSKEKIIIKTIKYTHLAGQLTKTLKIGLSMSDFLKAIIFYAHIIYIKIQDEYLVRVTWEQESPLTLLHL
ncbi:MAG: hypothetical protein BGO44_04640 [Legionella sp. 39-23]|nr:MAG: hypothetical protein BGO44_04640 [Legionella sp. 39-23]